MKKEIERRLDLKLEETIIPKVMEIMGKEKISLEKAAEKSIIVCGKEHQRENVDCHRKLHGYSICEGCPKYHQGIKKTNTEWEEIRS